MKASLYVFRPLLNGGEVAAWFARQGLRSTLAPTDMHTTIAYSKKPMLWDAVAPARDRLVLPAMAGARGVGLDSVNRRMKKFDGGALVMVLIWAPALMRRWQEYCDAGASYDYDHYAPHVTITYAANGVDPDNIKPFPGELHFGPEEREEITSTFEPDKEVDALDKAIVARLPVIIKARPDTGGRRLISVEASTEEDTLTGGPVIDFDGDHILQKALLGSASSFVANGHLDIDHLSEFGERLGIPDPSSYIVGRPLEVKAHGKCTFVLGEIAKAIDGVTDVVRHRYDEFWMSLQRDPPVTWYSSVYGFPTDMDDCTNGNCAVPGVTRFLIKSMDWRSLAFTRTPKNECVKGAATIVTAKAHLIELAKSFSAPAGSPPQVFPNSMDDVFSAAPCPNCSVQEEPSLLGYRQHFAACKGYAKGAADVAAHAAMHGHAMRKAWRP